MKKLLIAVAVITLAAVTHAATYNWSLTEASSYLSKNAYAFDSADRVAVISALTEGGASIADTIAEYAVGGPVQASGREGKEKFTGASLVADGKDAYSAFFILFDGAIADGNTYSVSSDIDVTANTSQAGSGSKAAFSATAAATFTTTDQKIGNVPEPTSAMLILLGIAGLALRRKQK